MKMQKDAKKKHMTVKDRIVILLTEESNITRFMLTDKLGKSQGTVDVALTGLRKLGYRIYPSKGPGTPLRIARSMKDSVKFVNWRRRIYLDTAHRMVMTESELGEQYRELSESYNELIKLLNNKSSYELPTGANRKNKR